MLDTRDLAGFQATFMETVTGARPEHAGLRIYHDTWFLGLIDVLRTRFEVCAQTLGEEAFNAFARDYVRSHPLSSGDCGTYGAAFPDFLSAHPHATDLPWLGDLAAFELAVDEAHHADDAEAGEFAALLDPAGRCDLHPSVRALDLGHDVKAFHGEMRASGAATDLPRPVTCDLLVARDRHDDVSLQCLAPLEAQFLRLIARHKSMFTTLEQLSPTEDDLAFLQAFLARLVTHGLLVSI